MEATVIGDDDTLADQSFNPVIDMIPADLSVEATNVHLNIAVGPKAELQINVPGTSIGLGFGVRLDVIRFDSRLSDFKSKVIPFWRRIIIRATTDPFSHNRRH